MKSRLYTSVALLSLALCAPAQALPAAKMTAFALVREGDKFIAPQAKDKITAIHSEKSDARLIPDVWYVYYYDSTTSFKTTEVKFVAGNVVQVKQPKHLLGSLSGTKSLEWRKLKVDSDRALAIAMSNPLLKKIDLQATQLWLDRTVVGSTWKVRFWMARMGRPGEMIEVGDLYISSKNGAVLKNDLHF